MPSSRRLLSSMRTTNACKKSDALYPSNQNIVNLRSKHCSTQKIYCTKKFHQNIKSCCVQHEEEFRNIRKQHPQHSKTTSATSRINRCGGDRNTVALKIYSTKKFHRNIKHVARNMKENFEAYWFFHHLLFLFGLATNLIFPLHFLARITT
jgi:hypothetical protein